MSDARLFCSGVLIGSGLYGLHSAFGFLTEAAKADTFTAQLHAALVAGAIAVAFFGKRKADRQ
jgi:hypothetical protein